MQSVGWLGVSHYWRSTIYSINELLFSEPVIVIRSVVLAWIQRSMLPEFEPRSI